MAAGIGLPACAVRRSSVVRRSAAGCDLDAAAAVRGASLARAASPAGPLAELDGAAAAGPAGGTEVSDVPVRAPEAVDECLAEVPGSAARPLAWVAALA